MAQLDALCPVEHIVVPNGFHRLDAPRYKTRYPKARVYCPPGARKKSEQRIAVDGALLITSPTHMGSRTARDPADYIASRRHARRQRRGP